MLDIQGYLSASSQRRRPDGRGSSAHAPLSPDGPVVKQSWMAILRLLIQRKWQNPWNDLRTDGIHRDILPSMSLVRKGKCGHLSEGVCLEIYFLLIQNGCSMGLSKSLTISEWRIDAGKRKVLFSSFFYLSSVHKDIIYTWVSIFEIFFQNPVACLEKIYYGCLANLMLLLDQSGRWNQAHLHSWWWRKAGDHSGSSFQDPCT